MAHSGDLAARGVDGKLLQFTNLVSFGSFSLSSYYFISFILFIVQGVSLNLEKLMETKTSAVKSLTSGIASLFKSNKVNLY